MLNLAEENSTQKQQESIAMRKNFLRQYCKHEKNISQDYCMDRKFSERS